ncbi:hypothetical protein COO09_13490 [Rhizorhabdus dicambivorans]|uniref:Uncharacterized protein n=1 Tax=Rhizorhabdus dicambivorans TaxID=1850238 RepID=A0A2A4FSQ1_9SPHN|nr:hypothetical protein [Brevundimonas diminuta]ATE66251.1 hypothetical protein CMV14_19150 [Rhizorhabdus dicambivorans]PCE41765.1 hypothetical protein COO09_13490 [Rhizorhabdus dicambivorans]
MTDWGAFANQWQTLISSGLAILAALIGAGFVYHQTRQARRFELDRLGRRHAAARSTLPLVLSSIMEYARTVARDLRRLYLAAPGNHIEREALIAWEIPPLPQGETAALAEVIEAASNEVAEVIADLLGRLQVQVGRLRGLHADVVAGTAGRRNILKSEIEEYIQDIADIHARCELLLDYARREADTVQPMPLAADKLRALFLMGFHEGAFDNVKATITRRGPGVLPSTMSVWRRAWNRIAAIWKARSE